MYAGLKKVMIAGWPFIIGKRHDIVKSIIRATKNKKSTAYLASSLNDLAQAEKDIQTKKWYESIDLFTTDGMPLVWYARHWKKIYAERVYGPDLLADLIRSREIQNQRHMFILANPRIENTFRNFLRHKNIILRSATWITAPAPTAPLEEAILKVLHRKPTIVWVGIGSPNQVRLAAHIKSSIARGVILCLGAAFEFTTRLKPEAPGWIQQIGLEWLFRLYSEPARLYRRYLIDIPLYVLRRVFATLGKR